jgi:outer membrane protein assembly factor BamB
VNIFDRFKGPTTEWDLAECLLVDGDRVICTPGGPDAVMAALDKKTGDTVWVTTGMTDMTSYVPPLLVKHHQRRIILTETSKFLIGVDADTGALLWKHEHLTQYDIHAVTPVYKDGSVYYVAGYKSGGGLLDLAKDGASYTVRWLDTELDCQHHGVMLVDGYLYGTTHHRGGGQMVCLDWATGKVMWTSKEITQANMEYADGLLYAYEGPTKGIMSLIKPSSAGLERVGQFAVTDGTKEHWAHPTIAHKRLYIRHGDALACYDIAAK